MNKELIRKYNIPGPRYTSYPTVPYWDKEKLLPDDWVSMVKRSFDESNEEDGISIYIHLPYCERLCTFCACNRRITVNHLVEKPYIDRLLKEWKMYLDIFKKRPKIKEIHLGGGTPTFFSPGNLKSLISKILSDAEVCDKAVFGFEGHPNNTTREHLETLYDLGFTRVSFGIQDFDPKVQDAINRVQTFEKVKEVVDIAKALGYTSVNVDLVYGLPFQRKKSIVDTLNKVKQLKPDRIAFYSYAHVPWHKTGQRKFSEIDLPADEEKRELYELGRDILETEGYYEIGMDHFALETDELYKAASGKTLHRNFMGYTPTYTQLLVGLGVSSISDALYGFAQNAKTVEEYLDLVDKGMLPIFRGHKLTNEDLIVRKHITNIMCRYETNWVSINDRHPVIAEGLERLGEILEDGLVTVGNDWLKVTEQGKPFLRNVCMAFDARLWRQVPETEVFSKTI